MVVIKDDMITERYSSLLNPNKPIPPFISRLTGIYDADVRGQPEFSEIAPQIAENCKDCFLIAHNVAFDLGFLNQRSEEHTSELQSRFDLVCRLLLEKKNLKTLLMSF